MLLDKFIINEKMSFKEFHEVFKSYKKNKDFRIKVLNV